MSSPPVLVGRPSDLVPQDGLVDAYATRIGGTAVLPAGSQPMPEYQCQHCGTPLVLLLQTHAPVSSAQAGAAVQNRFLYLLGCATDKCPGTWRALRCQLPSTTAAASSDPKELTSSQEADKEECQPAACAQETAAEPAGDGWGDAGAGQDTWGSGTANWEAGVGSATGWGEDTGAVSSSLAFDFDDLNAALDAAAESTSAQRAAPPQSCQACAAAPAADVDVSSSGSAAWQGCYHARCLPAFYLVAGPEAQPAAKLPRKEREHLQQLLSQYEQEAGVAAQMGGAGSSGGVAGPAAAAGTCLPSVEGGGESWGGEGYEPDTVLLPDKARQGALRAAFIKFAKRLAACPDQCARYSFGGGPLWPGDSPPAPHSCAQCGASAVFELQLMAPAIHYLEESADWLEEGGEGAEEGQKGGAAGVADRTLLRPPASWEWATVAVYSCSRSCVPPAGGCFVEEQVFAENE